MAKPKIRSIKKKRWSTRLYGPRLKPVPRVKHTRYTQEALANAVHAYKTENKTLRDCSRLFQVPVMTIQRHVKQDWNKMGRPCILNSVTELLIADSCVALAKWGFGLCQVQIISIAEQHLTKLGQPRKLGTKWFNGFMRRHKDQLSLRKSTNLSINRAQALTQKCVDDFFDLLKEAFKDNDLEHRPHSIWNVDESGYNCDQGNCKIVCHKGEYNPLKLQGIIIKKKKIFCFLFKFLKFLGNNEKTSYTVLSCANAAGCVMPPYVLYKAQHMWDRWLLGGPEGTRYQLSPSGWMESEQFFDWFRTMFVPKVDTIAGHKLLIYDGHNSHINIYVIDLAREKNISIICLPPHSSHCLQPLDKGLALLSFCT